MNKHKHPAADFRHSKLDDAANLFLPLQLEKLSSKVNLIRYPDLTYMRAFPLAVDLPAPGQTSYAYADEDISGSAAQAGASYSDKGPRVGISRKKNTSPVVPITAHYGFNLGEIESAMRLGMSLNQSGARAARRLIEQTMDTRCWNGDASLNIPGFLTGGITADQVAAGGGGSRLWANKTAAEIVADIRTAYQAILTAINGVSGIRPNRLALPATQRADLALRPRDSGTDETVLAFLLRTLKTYDPNFDIVETQALVGSGTGTTDEFALFRAEPEVLGQVLVKPYSELPPQEDGYDVVIHCSGEHGGVVVLQPKACGRFRGI
jgi:hypothetical protein